MWIKYLLLRFSENNKHVSGYFFKKRICFFLYIILMRFLKDTKQDIIQAVLDIYQILIAIIIAL